MADGNFTTTPITFHNNSPKLTGLTIGLVFFYSSVSFTAIVSNVLILTAVFRQVVPRNTVNIFLSSLAVSDLLMVLLSIFDCVAFIFESWVFSEGWCKMQSYLLELSFCASTFTLVAVSCERYLLLCFPHKKRRTKRTIYKMVLFVWFISLCVCSPLLDGYAVTKSLKKNGKTELSCTNARWSIKHQRIFYGLYSVVVYLLPLFIMAFVHWRISCSVKHKKEKLTGTGNELLEKPVKKSSICFTIQEEGSNPAMEPNFSGVHKTLLQTFSTLKRKMNSMEREKVRASKRMKAIRLLFVVTVTFFILWSPFTFFRILRLAGIEISGYLYKLSELLIFSSTAVNGFIYAFMSLPFRNSFKALIMCRATRDPVSRESGPSYSNSEENRLGSKKSHSANYYNGYTSSDAESKNTCSVDNNGPNF
ncbi:cholecystokinin receptor type A isoform X1 [Hydra vulgaris]|uniref:Cholecystokinin receptor type A n=1 Tax=Hydra vulgaris TaxID=6087 RepID=T2MFT6_HYDVU|nr:cholecystokinin receptor type A [Hydra vulgaris]XP_012554044.1 cholecystokinin receptor type A [Hydra vulgaris]XP_047131926.1 cholecystokinin receptor type A [Hydra vulgaris]